MKGRNIITNILPKRTNWSPSFRDTLRNYNGYIIDEMYVNREPVNSTIKALMDGLSQGELSENIKRLKYDDLYHLSLQFKLRPMPGETHITNESEYDDANQGILQVEKLDIPSLRIGWADGEKMKVKNIKRNLTINEFLQRAKDKIPPTRLYQYDALTQNCQVFLSDLLKANDLFTNDMDTFINQDASELLNINEPAKEIIRTIPRLGEALGIFVYGKGNISPETLFGYIKRSNIF